MIASLLKLNRLTGDSRYLLAAEKGLQALSAKISSYPGSMSSAAFGADYYFQDKIEIVLVGNDEEMESMLHETYRRFIPNRLIAISHDGGSSLPLFNGRASRNGQAIAYVCRNSTCRLPLSTAEELGAALDEL